MSILHLSHPIPTRSDRTLRARLRARLSATRLDEQLALGADPGSSPELAAHAEWLVAPRGRRALATGLRRAVMDARDPRLHVSASIHVARSAVRTCAPAMLALAAEIAAGPVHPRGVALTRRLLMDGAGPLYCARDDDDLARAVAAARDAL
jgi:hypothetical protein